MSDLAHWHKIDDEPSVFVEPPTCCGLQAAKVVESVGAEARRQLDTAIHAERVRIVTETLAAIDLYADQAGSLLTNEQSKDMLELIAARMADVVRKVGCICPRIEVTSFGGEQMFMPGYDKRCGMHDHRKPAPAPESSGGER